MAGKSDNLDYLTQQKKIITPIIPLYLPNGCLCNYIWKKLFAISKLTLKLSPITILFNEKLQW